MPRCSNSRKPPNAGRTKRNAENSNAKNLGKSEDGNTSLHPLLRLPQRLPSAAISRALVAAAASSRSAAARDCSQPTPNACRTDPERLPRTNAEQMPNDPRPCSAVVRHPLSPRFTLGTCVMEKQPSDGLSPRMNHRKAGARLNRRIALREGFIDPAPLVQ
jgi:hypothetical protein